MPGPVVLVDTREPAHLRRYAETILDGVEFAALPEADFAIPDRDTCLFGIERKTVSDFLGSLSDGRLVSQLARMRGSYTIQGLMIEGRLEITGDGRIVVAGQGGWSHASFQMVLLSLQRHHPDLVVWWTPNLGGSLDLIRALSRRGAKKCFDTSSLVPDPEVEDGRGLGVAPRLVGGGRSTPSRAAHRRGKAPARP